MSTAVARNLMAEMKLLGMFDAFDRLVTEATRDQWSCTDFLDAMLQAECDYRGDRKTKRRIKAAKFALRPAFEDFDFSASRSITKAQIKDLYSLHWLTEARPVLLIGQTGVGKTFIAQAVGLHACASGKSVLYMTFTTWLENLALARSAGKCSMRGSAATSCLNGRRSQPRNPQTSTVSASAPGRIEPGTTTPL